MDAVVAGFGSILIWNAGNVRVMCGWIYERVDERKDADWADDDDDNKDVQREDDGDGDDYDDDDGDDYDDGDGDE